MLLKKGTLRERLVATTGHALRTGSLLPMPTDHAFIEDNGIRFFVRVLSSLRRKDEARKKQDAGSKGGKTVNPFLPPEKDLLVADLTDTHLAVLNKFNVVEHHLLIVTRGFEDQDTLLTLQDFEALWLCMAEFSSLGFYNGGREAGASQQHKHLQLVPLPLAPEGPAIPIEPLLEGVGAPGEPCAIPAFSFVHSFVRLAPDIARDTAAAAKTSFALYGEMLRSIGLNTPDASRLIVQSMPYCFLVARGWMLLVPRSHEFFDGVSLNSLAYAGSLFVRNEEQLARLKAFGPMKALASAATEKVVQEGKQGSVSS
ncbi:MAG TPA: phosphorylase [Nitrospirota bacterium]|nr:phosphorylase [Nitrospirota bacterium]